MKEELQNKLVEILTSIQSAAGKASDFAMEQLPDIAQSYVAYGRAHETLLMVVLLIAFFSAVYGCYRFAKAGDTDSVGGIALFVGFPSGLFALLQASPFFLVWFAPKVWLLKEIAGMLK